MAFIRKYNKGGKTYLAEVENVREGGRVIQHFLRYVGREADGKTILSCSMSEAQVESVKLFGPLMVLHSIAASIGLPEILGEYSAEILSMVYAHCLDYKSLNQMKCWYERTDLSLILNLADLTERRLVLALDALESDPMLHRQQIIFERVKGYLGIKPKGVVYDVTNTYFYGKKCDLARCGHDKEQRKGYPLVQIGLVVTQEHGIPILHKTFPGNVHDSRTFADISKSLEPLGIKGGIAVMDRGVTSGENTDFLNDSQWKVLCGIKLDPGIRKALGSDFQAQDLCSLGNRIRMHQTVFYCNERPYKHGNTHGRLISCFNRRKAQDAEESRYDEIQSAQSRLSKGKTIKPDIQPFFAKNGRVLETKLNEERRFDGTSFIFTTSDLTVAQAVFAYFDKDVVEKCFQSLKGVVRLRPVRHWLYNRVEAHIFICYLSCLLLSILKMKVAGLEMSEQSALRELDGLYRIYLRDPKNGFKVGRLVALTRTQEKILRSVAKDLVKTCSE
jgi:transposase